MRAVATDEVKDEASYDLSSGSDGCAQHLPHVPLDTDINLLAKATEILEDKVDTFFTEYPPTPALSVSGLDLANEIIIHKPLSPIDCEVATIIRGHTEPEIFADQPLSCYRPPSVIDVPEDEATDHREEHPALVTHVITPSLLPVIDGQIILRPPQDWYQAYATKGGVVKSLFDGHDERSAVTSNTQAIADPVHGSIHSPHHESQDFDIDSIMAQLVSYSWATQSPAQKRKRSFTSPGPEADQDEKPMEKRQRLSPNEPVITEIGEGEDFVSANTECHETGEQDREVSEDKALSSQDDQTSVYEDSDDAKSGMVDTEMPIAITEHPKEPRSTTEPADAAQAHITTDVSGNESATFRDLSLGDYGERPDPATAVEQIAGPYIEAHGTEMEERVVKASTPPTPASSDSPAGLFSQTGRTEITFKSVEPPTDPPEHVESEANDQEADQDSSLEEQLVDAEQKEGDDKDSESSEDLSEVDEDEPSHATSTETQDTPIPQESALPLKQSTPDPESRGSTATKTPDPNAAPTTDAPAPQPATTAPTALRHEAEFHYERRATRSEARTLDPGSACIPSEEHDDSPAIKQEDLSTATATAPPHPADTQPPTPAAPRPKSSRARKAQHAPAPPQSGGETDPRLFVAKIPGGTRSAKEKRAATPMPTPTADPRVGGGVLGKRKTRRSSAREEEVRREREREGNIKRRLRGREA